MFSVMAFYDNKIEFDEFVDIDTAFEFSLKDNLTSYKKTLFKEIIKKTYF